MYADKGSDYLRALKNPPLQLLDTVTDIQGQLDVLFTKNFITDTPTEWLQQYPPYLQAIYLRVDNAQHDTGRDRQYLREMAEL